MHDVSERAFQLEGTGQWVKGKSADTFGPIGPWLVTPDEVPDSRTRHVARRGRQAVSERLDQTMVFGVPYLVSYLSRFMSLRPATSSPRARRRASATA